MPRRSPFASDPEGAAPLVSCEEAKKGGAAALPTGAKVEEARKALEQETGSARIVRVLVRAAGLVGGIDAQAERDAFNKKVAPIAVRSRRPGNEVLRRGRLSVSRRTWAAWESALSNRLRYRSCRASGAAGRTGAG